MTKVTLFDYQPRAAAMSLSRDQLVAEFVAPYAMSSNYLHSTAARHLICWLDLQKIDLVDVTNAALERFGKHRCRCPGFKATPNSIRQYMSVVRMFVHLLEQRGVIPSNNRNDISRHIGHFAVTGGKGLQRQDSEPSSFQCTAFCLLDREQWRLGSCKPRYR